MFARIAGGRRARFPVARLLSENAGTKRRVQHNRKTGFHPANLSERNKKFARLSKIICRRSTTKAKRKLKFDAGDQPGLCDFTENNSYILLENKSKKGGLSDIM